MSATDILSTLSEIEQAVTIYDSSMELLAWNDAYSHLGITPANEVKKGLHLADTYGIAARLGVFGEGDSEQLASSKFSEAIGQSSPPIEFLQSANGYQVCVRRFFVPGIGVAAVFTKVPELQNKVRQVTSAERIRQFFSTKHHLQHKFNNQLCGIITGIELARLNGDDNLLDSVLTSACRNSGSWWGSGRGEPVNLREFIDEVATCFRSVSGLDSCLSTHVDLDVNRVDVEPDEFFVCILNLLFNCLDSSAQVCCPLTLTVGNDPLNESMVQLSIEGAPFEPGTVDFGATTVTQFASRHNGAFELEESGGNAVMRLFLPAVCRTPVENELGVMQGAVTSFRTTGCRILFVEDEPAVSNSAHALLVELGYEVVAANTVALAGRIAEQMADSLDLVLSDCRLGSDRGSRLLEFCSANVPGLPFAFCTATPEEGRGYGVPVLVKPFSAEELNSLILRLSDKRSYGEVDF